jgi:hypothetical protein
VLTVSLIGASQLRTGATVYYRTDPRLAAVVDRLRVMGVGVVRQK